MVSKYLNEVHSDRVWFVVAGHSSLQSPPATTGNESFKFINKDGKFSVYVYSMPRDDFRPINSERNEQLAKALGLYSSRSISEVNSESDVLEHLMQNFGDILCIEYAIVNSWAMLGEEENMNLVFKGGSPNIWIVSNC
jgi:hypothetical protein